MNLRSLDLLLLQFPSVGHLTFGDLVQNPAYIALIALWQKGGKSV